MLFYNIARIKLALQILLFTCIKGDGTAHTTATVYSGSAVYRLHVKTKLLNISHIGFAI